MKMYNDNKGIEMTNTIKTVYVTQYGKEFDSYLEAQKYTELRNNLSKTLYKGTSLNSLDCEEVAKFLLSIYDLNPRSLK